VPSSRLLCKPEPTVTADPLPLVDDAADGRQPVDAEGVLRLSRDHGRDWDGRRLLALAPALVHQVQVAVHPGDLVGGEGVGAVIIWGEIKKNKKREAKQCACFLISKPCLGDLEGELGDSSVWWLSWQGSLVSCVPKATRWHCLSSSPALRLLCSKVQNCNNSSSSDNNTNKIVK